MRLYHATPKSNVEGILTEGLLPSHATGKIKGVWLHTHSKREWAVLHTQKRHRILDSDDIVVIEVDVPRSHLTRRWRGLWTSDKVVPVQANRIVSAAVLSESPITEEEGPDVN